MSTIFPDIFLSEEQKLFIKEPPHLLIQHIENFEKQKQYNNQIFQNTLFGLSLSCFQKLNLNNLFEKKISSLNNAIYQNYDSQLSEHNKEIEKRGMQVVQTLEAHKIEENLKNIFGKDVTDDHVKYFSENDISLSEQKSIFNQIHSYFKKLAEQEYLPAVFQIAYIEYVQHSTLTDEQKKSINKNLDFCIKNNFLFADHFKGILMLEGFYEDTKQEDALKHLLACGKKGFSSSYCILGELYEKNDIFKSIYYFDLAYKTGDVYAATMLGYIYLNNLLEYDAPEILIPKGIKYLDYAAKKGSINAHYMLGTVYYEDYMGLGVKTEDYEKAIYHLKKACKEKHEANTLLGHIYFKLIFDPKYYNHPLNEKYLKMSDHDFKKLLNNNLLIFIKDKDRKQNDFENHPGISVHTQYCLYYLSEGVSKDVIQCFYYLGYFFGAGVKNRVPVNYEQCLSLLKQASDFGHTESKSLLKYFSEQEEKSKLTN